MSISSLDAARRICELGSWKVTHLDLQKILYIAHMVYMGRNDSRVLIDDHFKAWDYGPIEPNLYKHLAIFGNRVIPSYFFSPGPIENGPEYDMLKETCAYLLDKKSSQLVAMTHSEDGAWAKAYVPGYKFRIANADIVAEYRDRALRKNEE